MDRTWVQRMKFIYDVPPLSNFCLNFNLLPYIAALRCVLAILGDSAALKVKGVEGPTDAEVWARGGVKVGPAVTCLVHLTTLPTFDTHYSPFCSSLCTSAPPVTEAIYPDRLHNVAVHPPATTARYHVLAAY